MKTNKNSDEPYESKQICSVRLKVRTLGFQPKNMGSMSRTEYKISECRSAAG